MSQVQLVRDLEDHIIRKVPHFDRIMDFFLKSTGNSKIFLDKIVTYFRDSLHDSDRTLIIFTLVNFFLDNVPDEYLAVFISSAFYTDFKNHIYDLMDRGESIPDILFSHIINWQFVFTFSEDFKRFTKDVEQYDEKADTGRVSEIFGEKLDEWEPAKDRYELERKQADLDKMFESFEIMTINEKLDILRKGGFSLQGELLRRYLACKHYMENRLYERLPPLQTLQATPAPKKLNLDELYRANLAYRDKLKVEIEDLKGKLINNMVL
jgi:hypothetical protein